VLRERFELRCSVLATKNRKLAVIRTHKNKAGDRPRPTRENGPDPIVAGGLVSVIPDFYAEFSAVNLDNEPLPDDRRRGILKVVAGEFACFSYFLTSVVDMGCKHNISCAKSVESTFLTPIWMILYVS